MAIPGTSAVSATAPRPWLTLRNVSILLILLAIGITLYLSYTSLSDGEVVCLDNSEFNCSDVQNSVYGKLFGIPLGYLGLVGNLVVLGLLLFEARIPDDYGLILLFFLLLFGSLFSLYLIYIQAEVLETFCPWCLAHELLYFLLFGITSLRVWRMMQTE